ncbi:MAG TPA: hypothetical protein VKU41_10535 [Polyangiaceae bacterium]|nr:hypothetical protein [Polyangiaceae bacterium]
MSCQLPLGYSAPRCRATWLVGSVLATCVGLGCGGAEFTAGPADSGGGTRGSSGTSTGSPDDGTSPPSPKPEAGSSGMDGAAAPDSTTPPDAPSTPDAPIVTDVTVSPDAGEAGGQPDSSAHDSGGVPDATFPDAATHDGATCTAAGQCNATHPCPSAGTLRVTCCTPIVVGGCGTCSTGVCL